MNVNPRPLIRRVVLSAGHTPGSPGAVSCGVTEHSLNVAYVNALYGVLLEDLSQTKGLLDSVVRLPHDLNLRVKTGDLAQELDSPETLAIEIHFNAFNTKAHGSEIFHRRGDMIGHNIGSHLLGTHTSVQNLRCRGLRTGAASKRGSLRWPYAWTHGLLWELAFMDNPEDLTKLLPSEPWGRLIGDSLRRWLIT